MTWQLTAEYERALRHRWLTQDPWADDCGETRVRPDRHHAVLEGLRHARNDIATLLAEIDKLRADKVRAETRSTQTLNELRRRADEVESGVRRAGAAVRRVEMVKVWTNEDSRQFVFADDLWVALHPEIASNLPTPAVEPLSPLAREGATNG